MSFLNLSFSEESIFFFLAHLMVFVEDKLVNIGRHCVRKEATRTPLREEEREPIEDVDAVEELSRGSCVAEPSVVRCFDRVEFSVSLENSCVLSSCGRLLLLLSRMNW